MSTFARPRRPCNRQLMPTKLEKLWRWTGEPMTPLAECITAAIVGTVTIILFLVVGLSV